MKTMAPFRVDVASAMPSISMLGFYFTILFLAVFAGLASAVVHPYIVLGIFLAPAFLLLAIFQIELALVLAVASIVGIVPGFGIPIAGVALRTGELLLLFLAGVVFLKSIYGNSKVAQTIKPLLNPLVFIFILYSISVTYSVIIKKDQFGLAETRNLLGWLTLPVAVCMLNRQFHRVDLFIRGFAIFTALLLVGQSVFGVQLIFSDRGAESISQEFKEIIRGSAGAAIFLVGYTLFYALGKTAVEQKKLRWIFVVNLLALGLLVTFTRGAWLATLVGAAIFFAITQAHRRMYGTLILSLICALFLGAGLMVVKPELVGAIEERLFSVADEGARGSSVGFRFDENQQALNAISKSPILGVGIGGAYKQYTGTRGTKVTDGEYTYIHNSYLGLGVKMGLLAVIVPFWIFFIIWRIWQRHKLPVGEKIEGYRLNIAAAFSAIAMFMVNALTQPEWLRLGGLTAMSLLLAIILSASQKIDMENELSGSK